MESMTDYLKRKRKEQGPSDYDTSSPIFKYSYGYCAPGDHWSRGIANTMVDSSTGRVLGCVEHTVG